MTQQKEGNDTNQKDKKPSDTNPINPKEDFPDKKQK